MKKSLLMFVLVVLFCGRVSASPEADGYTFGVFPHLPMTRLIQIYSPLIKELEQKLNKKIKMATRHGFDGFRTQLYKEVFDIAFIQPFDYPAAHDLHDYLPLARRDMPLTAILLVKKNSTIKSLKDIRGKSLVHPSPHAAVTRLTLRSMREIGLHPADVKMLYSKNHFACMHMVLMGKSDVCGSARLALGLFSDVNMTDRFRIIHETASIPHTLFVAHKRVPADDREIIQKAIISWAAKQRGVKKLALGPKVPFVKALDSDYDVIRNFDKLPVEP